VANRGEIARRVLRTLRERGTPSVAVYSDADAEAPHVREADEAVRIGAAPSVASYLDAGRILEAARAVGADAVHPGYGFLSESAAFASACTEAGLVFIGPPEAALRRMGSKIEARRVAEESGVAVLAGVAGEGLSDAALAEQAERLGFPLLVKPSAGGGGKGMRLVRGASELAGTLAASRREARASFGDEALLLERYLEAPRHVEIQVVADAHGRVIHLGERECSVQRRHQKVIEEAPSPAVDEALRGRMGAAAVALAKAVAYTGAGTVEFLLDTSGEFFFLEMNTRLQVEHPVTEAVTGLDLVELQLRVAEGHALPLAQEDVRLAGHAIEARLYAEDPERDFLPATGRIALLALPARPGLRIDSGIEEGTEVGIHYDPLLAKLVAHGASREEARRRLLGALEALGVAGVVTNRAFLAAVLAHPEFVAGRLDTHFIERRLGSEARRAQPDPARLRLHALVAALFDHERRRAAGGPLPPSIPSGWRNNRWRPQHVVYRAGETELEVLYVARAAGAFSVEVRGSDGHHAVTACILESAADGLTFEVDNVRRRFRVAHAGHHVWVHGAGGTSQLERSPRFPPARGEALAGACAAPMTGLVRQVCVAPGQRVAAGEVLVVLEAMKMEHALAAHAPGVVREVRVEVGQMVDPDQVLVVLEPEEAP
jgi:propionyl-CoA carboxylase alpha chain